MKSIIVLGAGFGGLKAALTLAQDLKRNNLSDKYEVVLIDRYHYHTYTPLLYEIAATSKETADMNQLHQLAAYEIKKIISKSPIRFIQDEIENVDLVAARVYLKNRILNYDYLILALGSETNYFGIPKLKENSLVLKRFIDALKIRDSVWNLAMTGQLEIKIVIGGAGSTGVEVSGELKNWGRELSEKFKNCRLAIEIIEAGPTILPVFPPNIIKIADERLCRLGVKILTKEIIIKVETNKLYLKSGKIIPFDIFIWTGGVRAPKIIEALPFKKEIKGRVIVEERLACIIESPDLKLDDRVYAIGDLICFSYHKTGQPVPGVAKAAITQGKIAARNILEIIKVEEGLIKKPRTKIYEPKDYPYIIPVGGKFAIAKIGPFVISGFFGWILKGLVELNYLISIMPLFKAVKIWLKGLRIFIQNDRLG